MDRRSMLLLILLALPGCQTGTEYQAAIESDLSARLERYNGVSIAEFQARTGMLPVDAYPAWKGRIFVFRTSPVYLTLPATDVTPAITRTAQCQLLIRAVNDRKTGTADAWIILGTERTGACNGLPI